MIYRRITLDVAYDGDESNELMPGILTTIGAVESPWIGGTGIQLLDVSEEPLLLITQDRTPKTLIEVLAPKDTPQYP
jgi:hypothetical protein